VEALHGIKGWHLLQVNLKNAFNSIARPAVLEALERLCPSMKPWVRQAFQPAAPAGWAGGNLVYQRIATG